MALYIKSVALTLLLAIMLLGGCDKDSNQKKIAAAIREAAPEHTIVTDANLRTSPNAWDQIGSLVETEILEDKNVVYSFHFYEPMNFTHQGATWGTDFWQHLKAIPYPSTPENVRTAINESDPSVKSIIQSYGQERWNVEKIMARFQIAGEWAQQNKVPVYCGEFGCINWTGAPAGSREAWYHDVKAAIDKHNFGWAIWFSVDEEVKAGLGLR